MTDIITWLASNWALIGQIAGLLLALATVITGLTETPKDDSVVALIRSLLGRIGLARHADATGSLKLPGQSAGDSAAVREAHVARLRETLRLAVEETKKKE